MASPLPIDQTGESGRLASPGSASRRPPAGGAVLALALVLPAPSLANWLGMVVVPNTIWAPMLFAALKMWMLGVPLAWYLGVERQKPSLSPMRRGGAVPGIVSGLAIAAIIGLAYVMIGTRLIDLAAMREAMVRIGLDKLHRYLLGAAYWITANSLLEEFLWRWFVVYQARRLMPDRAAILFSAAGFTLHHIVATSLYFPVPVVALISLGIFLGGAIWSWLYVRHRSIWPGYISHAIADLAVFIIGYQLIFGS